MYRKVRSELHGIGPDAYRREAARRLGVTPEEYDAAFYAKAVKVPKLPTPDVKPSLDPAVKLKVSESLQVFIGDAVTPNQAKLLRESVLGSDTRSEFIRRALSGYDYFEDAAEVYVAYDKASNLVGALSLIKHTEEEAGIAYNLIDYMGARGARAGTVLVRKAMQQSLARGVSLYAEATTESVGFWRKMGFIVDPDGVGTEYYGLSLSMLISRLREVALRMQKIAT